jgi:predicted O-methyltransferase YrrM
MNITLPPPSINTWQSPFELELLLLHFRHASPKHICELGSADGGSIWCWAHNCVPGAHILSVDWWKDDVGYPDNRIQYGHWALRNTCTIDWVKGDTRDDATLNRVREFAPFDWMFIDAGHALIDVTSDWERYGPLVSPGGIVVFHDITPNMRPNQVEVRLLWDRLKETRRHVEIIENAKDDKLGTGILWV